MIRAIVTSCGYIETQNLSSMLWVAMEEINEPMEALKLLKDDLLRSFLDSQTSQCKTTYTPYEFEQFVIDVGTSTCDTTSLIPNDDEAHFWPYESFSCLFDYLLKEILFINDNFEKIMSSLVTEEEVKKMFHVFYFDRADDSPKKLIQIVSNPNDVLTVELDYERILV